jgi:hypothetical protein
MQKKKVQINAASKKYPKNPKFVFKKKPLVPRRWHEPPSLTPIKVAVRTGVGPKYDVRPGVGR